MIHGEDLADLRDEVRRKQSEMEDRRTG
jgi:hypothetical protein